MSEAASPPIEGDRARWQFSLRSMLLLTLTAAVLSALYRVAPQLDVFVAGIAPAIWTTLGIVRNRRRRGKLSRLAACCAIASWCACYLASIGPAILIAHRCVWTGAIFERLYSPIEWLHKHTPAAAGLEWYVAFWRDLG
ncbi:MAG TPA: hypothetical protein VN699_06165 [Pirellulales bacterium]|nr:hypothetical protein [Pirellulales bacterium]